MIDAIFKMSTKRSISSIELVNNMHSKQKVANQTMNAILVQLYTCKHKLQKSEQKQTKTTVRCRETHQSLTNYVTEYTITIFETESLAKSLKRDKKA